MTQKEREDYIRQMLERYFDGDTCIGELLADQSGLPGNMTIEDAVYVYARLMKTIEGNRVTVSNEEQEWEEDITEWFDIQKMRRSVPSPSSWHDVKAILPEGGDTEVYLIYNGKIQFALYMRDHGWTPLKVYDEGGNRLVFADVKYWMTIPNVPRSL